MLSIDKSGYLKRINFSGEVSPDETTFFELHQQHVFHIPFENLDIHYGKLFDLSLSNIFHKVVNNDRGGFCYELNSLFHSLLVELGFTAKIISASILAEDGSAGPPFDHMALCVEFDGRQFLADVGYGDLFTRPLEIKEGIQSDGRNLFVISRHENGYVLSMSSEGGSFAAKYIFSLSEVSVQNFDALCLQKQRSPQSYFVKNTVCTKPTENGRVTLLNGSLIEKTGSVRTERLLRTDGEIRAVLKDYFGIVIP